MDQGVADDDDTQCDELRRRRSDTVDYSTGSVGIGATAPIWGAIARRYAADTAGTPRGIGEDAQVAVALDLIDRSPAY